MEYGSMQILEIEKELIPYYFTLDYREKVYEIGIKYNAEYDFFTLDLFLLENQQKRTIVLGEKIMYGKMLFSSSYYVDKNLPKLIPWDFTNTVDRVGWRELGENVCLVVVEDDSVE